ncbi:hypothetical protein KIH86_09130 [Paenibacillus sp. HN-1]|uniref:hypothetical protein n=1 Tax=Paenibacillus TaxID=44249 RepID=UPI001CA9B271|nr:MULTISPECIES: hypothetical protein [Paenibacillus]MBY9079748.1 hypothetical protein [Paenibacillus sp. CGMCC 1.18879]MBY9084392.1 hypothetical protein [Paenibacillus sinensis]
MGIYMNPLDLETFEDNYRAALSYHSRAEQFKSQDQRYSLVFNVACVALERYLVAMCYLYDAPPLNHNYICLMNAAETVVSFPAELSKEIRSLDFIFGICSLDDYFHGTPEPQDADRVLGMCEAVRDLFDPVTVAEALAEFAKLRAADSQREVG